MDSISSSPDSSSSSFLLDNVLPLALRLGTVVTGLVSIAVFLLYVKQDSLLYFPTIGEIPRRPSDNPRGYRSPAERQVPFEDCRIRCEDGVHIHAWLLLHTTGDGTTVAPKTPTLIFFHGNAGNIGLRLPNAIQMVQRLKANVLMVEYRGYGESDNYPPDEAGLRLDAEAALRFALDDHPKIDPDRVFLFGRSLGGAVAFHLADYARRHNLPLAGVMVENTFTGIAGMVDHLMPLVAPFKALVLRIGWDSTTIVPDLRFPILYLAGSADEIVPHDHMQELVQLSKSSVKVHVHIIQGGKHNESWLQGGAAYWEAIVTFMKEAVEISATCAGTGTAGSVTIGYSGTGSTNTGQSASSIPTMPTGFVEIAKEASSASTSRNSAGSTTTNKPKDV